MKKIIKKLYKIRLFYILINHIYNFYITSKLTNPSLRGYKLKRLNKEIDFFINKILNKENFAFARNADGERAIMLGISVESQEKKWTSPNYVSKLGRDIFDSLSIDAPNFYYAISCPCCDIEAYYWYASRIKNKNLTSSNVWINANFKRFKSKFELIKRDAVLIANYRAKGAKIGNLNIIKHYEIDDDCISFWENHAPNMLDSIKKDFKDSRDLLFVVSAGPMSSPIIKELFLFNSNNTYVDFGSSIDSYYIPTQTRPYQDRHSIFGSRNCYIYRDFNCDVSVIFTLYKRSENLKEQVNALLNQSLRPKELILFIDTPNKKNVPQITSQIPNDLQGVFDNVIRVDYNVGVWGRFAGGLLAKSKYICIFDDDTIPAHRWLESCHREILKKDGIYGGMGILSNNLAKYPFDLAHRTFGWYHNPPFAMNNKKTIRVDFAGHCWFLRKDYLGAMWVGASEFYALSNVAEDVYLSFALKKYLNINTYIPPHKDKDFFSSTKGMEYGKGEEAISASLQNLEKMNNALRCLKYKYGMKETSFSLKWYLLYTGRIWAKKLIKDEKKLESLKSQIKSIFRK